jgi:hypothetical protein
MENQNFVCGLYGYGTWSLTLREEHRLRVFEDRVLRRDEVTEGWCKLHNDERRNLYSSLSVIRMIKSRKMRWAGHIACMAEMRSAYRMLVGKPEGKRPLGRPRNKWVDNIKMDLRETGWGSMDWTDLAQCS